MSVVSQQITMSNLTMDVNSWDKVTLIEDACRGVDLNEGDVKRTIEEIVMVFKSDKTMIAFHEH